MQPDATLLAPGPAPGGSSELSEGAGWPLSLGSKPSPRSYVSLLHLLLILRLFHLTFKKED